MRRPRFTLWMWLMEKLAGRKYFWGIDPANDRDYGAEVRGYMDKNGVMHITETKITK